jgi:hypothetical protein
MDPVLSPEIAERGGSVSQPEGSGPGEPSTPTAITELVAAAMADLVSPIGKASRSELSPGDDYQTCEPS